MPLAVGTRLGPYAIHSLIGAGGMGEVYRARDTRLDRDVAIKVLPPAFATDIDRRARLEREAKAIAALSHPNILAIHDTGVHAEQLFVVTELLEGQTLRDSLHAGTLPIRKSIDIAVQIARGLAAAHDKGIIHRDLKPENVFLLNDGQVKILDFGLARSVTGASDATATVGALTDPGMVMGTAGYMAPEQVRGHETDARTDLFALGVVLYEMLSGRRAFVGDTAADTMFAVVKEDPPELTSTRTDLSPALDRIVRHCLEKNPIERFQNARDVAFALEALGSAPSSVSREKVEVRGVSLPPRWRWLIPSLVAALFVSLAVLGTLSWRLAHVPTEGSWSYQPLTFRTQFVIRAAFGPDGETVVYDTILEPNRVDVLVLHPGAIDPQPLRQNARLLGVSSDGIAAILLNPRLLNSYRYQGTLARIPIGVGGEPRELMEHVTDAAWGPDGELAIIREVDGVSRLEYPINKVVYQTTGALEQPRFSPRGRQLAVIEHPEHASTPGFPILIDGQAPPTRLANFGDLMGLAWSSTGDELIVSAGEGNERLAVYAVPATTTRSPALRRLAVPASARVLDVGKNGVWLLVPRL